MSTPLRSAAPFTSPSRRPFRLPTDRTQPATIIGTGRLSLAWRGQKADACARRLTSRPRLDRSASTGVPGRESSGVCSQRNASPVV